MKERIGIAISDTHFGRPNGEYSSLDSLHTAIWENTFSDGVLILAGDIFDSYETADIESITQLIQKNPQNKSHENNRILAVLGNHEQRKNGNKIRESLKKSGIVFLDEMEHPFLNKDISFVGAIGLGCGYFDRYRSLSLGSNSEFEDLVRNDNMKLAEQLDACSTNQVIAVLHLPPIVPLKNPIGEYDSSLNEIITYYQPDLIIHGHFHIPNEIHHTPSGVPLINVAAPQLPEGHTHASIYLPNTP